MMDASSFPKENENLQKDINTIIELLDSEVGKEDGYNARKNEIYGERLTCQVVVGDEASEVKTTEGETVLYIVDSEKRVADHASTSNANGSQGETCIGEFLHVPEDGTVLTIMPNTPEVCLIFNQAYQGMCHDIIAKLQTLLENNREQQRIIQEELDEAHKRGRPSKKVRLRSRPITLFAAPYFRDVNHCIPPPNEDTKLKERTKESNAYTAPPRPWLIVELKRLTRAVKANAKQLAMEPLMTRKDYLCEKLDSDKITEEEEEEVKKKLKSTEADLKKISEMPDRHLLEPRGQRIDWLKISAVDMEGLKSPEECELMWNNYLHPSINKEKWSEGEDAMLSKIAEKYQYRNWDAISQEMKTNRTAIQCLERFQSELNPSIQKGPWSKEEDDILKAVVDTCRIGNYIPWNLVAYYIEGRSRSQIINRWSRSLQPGIKKGGWSKEEDVVLVASVKKYGPRWNVVKDFLPGRTNYQCRERYRNSLDDNLKLSHWTKAEDKTLVKLVKKYGLGKWTNISKHLPGRTDNMVLQRYKTIFSHRPDLFSDMGEGGGTDEDSSVNCTEEEDENDDVPYVPTQSSVRVIQHRINIFNSVQNAIKNILYNKPNKECIIENVKNFKIATEKSDILPLSKSILCPRRKHRNLKLKTEEELAVDAVLDVLFTPAVVCGGDKFKKKRCIAQTRRETEGYLAGRSLLFQALKAEDPKVNYNSSDDEHSDKEPEESFTCEGVQQLMENCVLGAHLDSEIPVLPPSSVTLDAFKILLVCRKRLTLAAQHCPSLDVALSLKRWGNDLPLRCPRCKCMYPLVKTLDEPDETLQTFRNESSMSGATFTSEKSQNSSSHIDNASCSSNDNASRYNGSVQGDILLNGPVRVKEEVLDDADEAESSKRKVDSLYQDDMQSTKRPRSEYSVSSFTHSDEEYTIDSVSTELYEECMGYPPTNVLCLKCERLNAFQRSFNLLQKRFVSLFFWPALMSAIKPEEFLENDAFPEEPEEKAKPRKRYKSYATNRRKKRKPWITALLKKKYGIKPDEDNLPFDPDDNSYIAQGRRRRAYLRYRKNRPRSSKVKRKRCVQIPNLNPENLRRSARQAAKIKPVEPQEDVNDEIQLQQSASNEEQQLPVSETR